MGQDAKNDLEGFLDDLEGGSGGEPGNPEPGESQPQELQPSQSGESPKNEPPKNESPQPEPGGVKPSEPQIPEKFKGKPPEEIAQAYVELEKKLGEQGTELGSLRKQIEILTNALDSGNVPSSQAQPAQPQQSVQPTVSPEEELNKLISEVAPQMYEDTQGALNKLVKGVMGYSNKIGEERYRQTLGYLEQIRQMEEYRTQQEFISKYPDLANKPELVNAAYQRIQPQGMQKYMQKGYFDRNTYWEDLANEARTLGGLTQQKVASVPEALKAAGADDALIQKVETLIAARKNPPPSPSNLKPPYPSSQKGNTIADELTQMKDL